MNINRLLQSKKRGSAMALVLVVLVLLLVMGLGLLSLGQHSRIFAVQTTSEIAARCAADAGLTKAVFEMNKKLETKPWSDSTLPGTTDEWLPNSKAAFSYEVTGDQSSGFNIQSTGSTGRAQKTVNATLQLRGLFKHAIVMVENISMKNSNLVTGYNSATGETDLEAQIGTLSTAAGSIILGNGTINGDVFVGVGGDVATVIQNQGAINGETYALGEEYVLPTITPPSLPDKGTINVVGTTLLSPADNGKYTAITSPGGILEINGGDVVLHITGNIDMDNGSKIWIKSGSSLTIYMDGNIILRNDAGITNETGVCTNFRVYSTGGGVQQFQLKNNSDAFGLIYAPNTDIVLMNNANLYGSMTARSFTMMNNGTFYYDVALRNVSINDEGVRFVIKRWSEQ